jgi:2-polyprenyl-3-methyl-5-hydroxy-6-metoxy-1,4-benzoquinol methylase
MTQASHGTNPLDGYLDAYGDSFPYHRENLALLATYAEFLRETIERRRSRSVLSLGIGHSIVAQSIAALIPATLRSYRIVEGSPAAVQRFRETQPESASEIVLSLFETFDTARRYDMIEMGFVLEHVADPELVLRRFTGFLAAGGVVIAAVPNALSLHRRLGHAAGLLADPYALSAGDRALGHRRYFDMTSFTALTLRCGLRQHRAAGLMLKPFSTAQLDLLDLSPAVWQALCSESRHLPEIANAFAVELEPAAEP